MPLVHQNVALCGNGLKHGKIHLQMLFNVAQSVEVIFIRVGNAEKGENAGYQHFFLFLQCF